MVKKIKIKDKDHHLAIAIKKNYEAGMRQIDIAHLFNIDKQRVSYWIKTPIKKRIRRTKLTRREINRIVKWARNKPIIECKVSAKNIQSRYNRLSKRYKEKKLPKKISLSTANRILNKFISKPRVIRKVFFLKPTERNLRLNFCKFMKEHNIGPENLFFTDESIFPLTTYLNRGTNKIRITNKMKKKLKSGEEKAINLLIRPQHKFNNGIMVSGGICKEGLGGLIFHSGNINSFAYKQVLKFYKEDLNKYSTKIFQQDGARCHSSKLSKNLISGLFKDKFIPTWDNGPKINGEFIPRWPPNSPDLSAIEIIWGIIKHMLILFPPKNLESLKATIKTIWESIPKEICENIIQHMKYRWELCIKYNGRRLDKELLKKIPKIKNDFKFKLHKTSINGVRISYNEKFIKRLKNKDIREKNKEIAKQTKIEKIAKEKYERLLKMKPKEYKNISSQEKKDIKFAFEYEKAKTDVLKEEKQKLENMCPLEYLSILNEDTKQKLIGLCMDRTLLDEETLDGSEKHDDEEEEEIEEEEKEVDEK